MYPGRSIDLTSPLLLARSNQTSWRLDVLQDHLKRHANPDSRTNQQTKQIAIDDAAAAALQAMATTVSGSSSSATGTAGPVVAPALPAFINGRAHEWALAPIKWYACELW